MTDERLTQLFYRLMRDHVSFDDLALAIYETKNEPAIYSDKSRADLARILTRRASK